MDKNTFTFNIADKLAPDQVIRNKIELISEYTKNYVIGNIAEYEGPICSYTKFNPIYTLSSSLQSHDVDIQDELGEQGVTVHKYEVFLSAKNLERYKYRIMLLEFGELSYPVTIVMNSKLAHECLNDFSDTLEIKSMTELNDLLDAIFNSKHLLEIIQSIINESIRRNSNVKSEE